MATPVEPQGGKGALSPPSPFPAFHWIKDGVLCAHLKAIEEIENKDQRVTDYSIFLLRE